MMESDKLSAEELEADKSSSTEGLKTPRHKNQNIDLQTFFIPF